MLTVGAFTLIAVEDESDATFFVSAVSVALFLSSFSQNIFVDKFFKCHNADSLVCTVLWAPFSVAKEMYWECSLSIGWAFGSNRRLNVFIGVSIKV